MGGHFTTRQLMDTSSLLDLVSAPIEPKTIAGEGSDEEEEGEDIGDLGDLTVTPLSPVANTETGEGDDEDSGEDIGDVLADLQVTPVHSENAESSATADDEGEELGDILDNATITPVRPEASAPPQASTPAPAPTPKSSTEATKQGQTSQVTHVTKSIKRVKAAELTSRIPTEAFGTLADGFIESYEPALKKMQDMLKEYQRTQEQLLSMVASENEKMANLPPELVQAIALFNQMPLYQNKIQALRREMTSISERVRMNKNTLI